LKFEHLIEINDLLNPLTATLTRAQLWRGLVRRAEQPEDFVLGLDGCRILERRDNELLRELTFGKVIIRDRVRFAAGASVQYRTEAPPELAGALLTMSIEEPQPQQLFVRFQYDHPGAELDPDPEHAEVVANARRSAYTRADIDTIKTIRRYAHEGLLHDA
jgi:hypothetical protein